ncbi:unextended protein isoform X2 [Bombyx mori]|uniref:Uncharacterized protein n=1 Tax=Bombyx mori TaxID=7091 RepID=A0A8R2RA28_BOMMO|nr:metal transporter CNNM4 isoform X2 [Bombyx mori]
MASVSLLLRTCGLLIYLITNVNSAVNNRIEQWIFSMKIDSINCDEKICKYLLNVRGGEFIGHYSWRLTSVEGARGGSCDVIHPNYEIRAVEVTQFYSKLNISVPLFNGKIYFCLFNNEGRNNPFGGQWVHQGSEYYLQPKNDSLSEENNRSQKPRSLNELQENEDNWIDLSHDIDVNYLPRARPARNDNPDVEIFRHDDYIALDGTDKVWDEKNNLGRFKRADGIAAKAAERSSTDLDNVVLNKNASNDDGSKDDTRTRAQGSASELFSEELIRKSRQIVDSNDFTSMRAAPIDIFIEGIRIEESEKEPHIEDGIPSVLADTAVTIRVFGDGLTSKTAIAFTRQDLPYGQPCKFLLMGEYMVKEGSVTTRSALFDVTAPPSQEGSKIYICAKNLQAGADHPTKDKENYYHQGTESWKAFATHNTLLPLWVSLSLILICLTFSALFSGLNLGLMSLDRTELKIIANTGTETERKYARAIMPVRDHGNYLLCSILLGNVAVNSTFTILLDELTSGLFAVIFSTLAIVLLGEITPQAICSRHGLMIGAKSIMITKAVMALTAPMAYPVSKLLDYFLGEEIGSVYNRERLKELIKVTTGDLDKDEVNIISGALEMRKKTVSDVMTKMEDVFMLPITSVLDFETMSEIVKSGYSRIPVYEGHRGNIVTVLFIKDLAFVDPDDNTPLRTLCQYYQNPCNFVFEDVTLDVMFKQFKEGHKGHMAFVHRINNEGEGDPFYETIGLVTLEDVIEEMIQAEIVDETDVFMDNRSKRRRNRPSHKLQDFAAFAERHENQRIHISPQLTLATFQFLSTSVDAFRPDVVSETVLRRLLRQDVIQHIKLKGKTRRDSATYVYHQGKPVDYFVLILEGRVEVTVGRENLIFEAGPFTYFGVQALTQNVGVAESPTPSAMGSLQNINMDSMLRHTFVPDYSVRAISSELFYLTVKRALYLAAKRATLMEKGALSKGTTNEQFDTEVDKLLQSVDEDISVSGEHRTPSRQVSPNPPPVSASPHVRATFASPDNNGDVYTTHNLKADEEEKLLK